MLGKVFILRLVGGVLLFVLALLFNVNAGYPLSTNVSPLASNVHQSPDSSV